MCIFSFSVFNFCISLIELWLLQKTIQEQWYLIKTVSFLEYGPIYNVTYMFDFHQ